MDTQIKNLKKSNVKLSSVGDSASSSIFNPDARYFQIHFEQIQNQLRDLQEIAEKLQYQISEIKQISLK